MPAGQKPGFLSRENIIAKPGFNRWLVPPAALAIHLCIGMSYGLSVFWLPLSHAIGLDKAQACPAAMSLGEVLFTQDLRLARQRSSRRVRTRHRLSRPLGGRVRRLAGAGGSAQSGRRRRVLLGRRLSDRRLCRLYPPALAALAWRRHHRRHRPWPWLYLAGVDADQMVSRPARHGDRHGHHGLWRRRPDRLAARQSPDQSFQDRRPRSASGRRWRRWESSISSPC